MTKRVAILISGGGSNMVSLVEAMQEDDFDAEPVLVLANDPDAGGLTKAQRFGVKTAVVDHRPYKGDRAAFEVELNAALEVHQPDVICLAGFMRILTEDFINRWAGKMLNIHPSLLPKYKGLNTHQRALDAGDIIAGCSVHIVTPELDAGPVVGQIEVPILAGDTADTLAARVIMEEHKLYPSALKVFANS
jgi:phosphoribosylglycinamide formyltransferase-1